MTRQADTPAPRSVAARYLDQWEAHLSLTATAGVRPPAPDPQPDGGSPSAPGGGRSGSTPAAGR